MNNKVVLKILIVIMFIMPIVSIEDIVPWAIALFFIHKSIKGFKAKDDLKPIILNTVYCGGIIFFYNVIARYIENILIKAWL
ncbi:hypothetical protein [Clostridium tertium]|uniref:Uncharacterized protein n=1 Tax=Clostridium tertium TaxID=1559 RepID=A0A6N3BFZ9_9CLOT